MFVRVQVTHSAPPGLHCHAPMLLLPRQRQRRLGMVIHTSPTCLPAVPSHTSGYASGYTSGIASPEHVVPKAPTISSQPAQEVSTSSVSGRLDFAAAGEICNTMGTRDMPDHSCGVSWLYFVPKDETHCEGWRSGTRPSDMSFDTTLPPPTPGCR